MCSIHDLLDVGELPVLEILQVEVDDDIVEELLCLQAVVVLVGDADVARHVGRVLAELHHRLGTRGSLLHAARPPVRHRRLRTRHLLLNSLNVLGRAPHQDLIGVFALQVLEDGGEVLLEDSFVLLVEFLREDRNPLLGLVCGLNVKVETLAIGHLQHFSRLLTGCWGYVEEQQWHLFAEMCEDFVDFLHGNVECDHLAGVDDPRNLDLDSLVRDGDLVLGKDFIIADSYGSTGQRTPVALSVHNVGIGQHPIA